MNKLILRLGTLKKQSRYFHCQVVMLLLTFWGEKRRRKKKKEEKTPPGKSSVSPDGLQDTRTCALVVFCVKAMQKFVAEKTGFETVKLIVYDSSQVLHILVPTHLQSCM